MAQRHEQAQSESRGVDLGRGPHTAGWAVAAIVCCQLMLMVDGVIVTVALPRIRDQFDLGAVSQSWVVSAYALAFAGLLLVSGRIGAIVGPRRLMLIGVVVFVVASAAGGLAPTGELLIAARAVQGAGAALSGPALMVLLVANTPEGPERLRGMSWFIIASSAGSAVGLIAGGVLTVTLGWRWVMLVNVPVGVLVIVGTLAFVRETGRVAGRLDIGGAIASAVVMVGLVYGLTRAAQQSWTDPIVLGSFAAAVIGLAALPAIESRAEHPVVPLGLLHGARRATPYLAMLLMPAMMIGFFTFSVLLLQDGRGYDALETGLLYLPWAAAVMLGARAIPQLLVRLGERRTVALGALLAVIGALAFAFLAGPAPLWLGVLIPCFVVGFGPALVFTPATNRIMADAGDADAGAAAALFQSLQQLGGAIGVAALTSLYASRLTTGADSALQAAVIGAAVVGVALLVLVTAVPGFPWRAPSTPSESLTVTAEAVDRGGPA